MKVSSLALAAGFAVALTASAGAQDASLGESLFAANCGTCHGSAGQGDGEFAQYLNVRPSNLTLMANENDGEFPYLYVFQVVDGRTGVRGHFAGPDMPIWGSGFQMPVWGEVFERQLGETGQAYGRELLVRARITALADHIESLQVE